MSVLRAGADELVRVLVPPVATFEAAVVRAVAGAAELRALQRPDVPMRFLHRRRATIVSPAGDRRLDGRVLAVPGPGGQVRDDLLHFLPLAVPLAPRRPQAQRRDDVRVELIRPVAMVPDGIGTGWLNGFTRNVSAGGVLVAGAEVLEAGDRLRVRFELRSEEDFIDVPARVVRADDAWGLRGLRMEDFDARERERLVRFIFERQRMALAALRARAG